jgi:hypothetical protein
MNGVIMANIKSMILFLLFLAGMPLCYTQENKHHWGISAPILTTADSKELALSRKLGKKTMVLLWGGCYYDKNIDFTPNQDVFRNLSYFGDLELRRSMIVDKKIKPYLGLVFGGGYSRAENKDILPYNTNREFITKDSSSKDIRIAFSFGAEYFITQSVSIFIHSRLFKVWVISRSSG